MSDSLTGFVFANNIAHGAFVSLHNGVDQLLGHRDYSDPVRTLIGEAMAAMPLLATHLKFEGRINLQFQAMERMAGEKRAAERAGLTELPPRMQLLVAQVDHHLHVRGMAKAPADLHGSFTELLNGGLLALLLEPSADNRPASQAVVLIQGESLAEALEGYFVRSEQLPTMLRLAADGDRLAGFMLQRMPLEHTRATEEDWEHLTILADTLTREELLKEDANTLIRRLFGNEELAVLPPRPVTATCRCSHAGISTLLLSLGRDEVDAVLADQGKVEITCEFCGRQYRFSPADVNALFKAVIAEPNERRH